MATPSPTLSPSPPPAKKKRQGLPKVFFMMSLFHAVYTSIVFVGLLVLFSVYGTDVIHFSNRYRSNPSDARSAFNPIVFVDGWAIVVSFAVWDYCALGAVLAATEQRNYGIALRRPYSHFWCCRSAGTNDRLTESCHGFCDRPCARILAVSLRVAMVSAMMTISCMTAMNSTSDGDVQKDEKHAYILALVTCVAVVIEWPLTIAGSIFHSIFTYDWINNWHRIEVMAVDLSIHDDSASFSFESHEID